MKLDHITLVNWGALRDGDYPVGNMTLLTGPTGSGKSTFLDALQTVMTAAYQNIFSFNPGQDETTQSSRNGKTKRTLWSYITGAEDNLFARPDGANGYVVAVFKPSEGEVGKPFTALVGVAARVDGSGERRQAVMEQLAFVLVDDASLNYEDLTTATSDNIAVVPVRDIERHLKSNFPRVVNFRDSKREYLCQLYGRFRGVKSVSFQEAEAAARAWSQSIAHKPIGSVDELVKTQILEHDPQGLSSRISQISDLMRQVASLRAEGERLTVNIERLTDIAAKADGALTAHETAVRYRLLGAKRAVLDTLQREGQVKAQIAQAQEAIGTQEAKAKQFEADKKGINRSQVQVEAQLSGIPAAEQKRRIDDGLRVAQVLANESLDQLSTALGQAETLVATATQLAGMQIPPTFRELRLAPALIAAALRPCVRLPLAKWQASIAKLQVKDGFTSRAAQELIVELAPAEASLASLHAVVCGPEQSFLVHANAQLASLRLERSQAEKEEQELARRKANLAGGGADYPRTIQYGLQRFKEELPAAQVQVLCDLIEPVGEKWQPAIEGYMNMARFNFVVEPAYEQDGIDFARRRDLRVNVIQGSMCMKSARPERVPSDSIIHELVTEHPVAKAYLMEQYGPVVKVPDSATLRTTPRGLTQDGKGSGGRTMFVANEDELVFGKAAKARRLEQLKVQHEAALRRVTELKGEERQLVAAMAMASDARLPAFGATAGLERAARDIETGIADLSRLDLTEVEKLEAQATILGEQLRSLEEEIRKCNVAVGTYQATVEERERDLARLESARERHLEDEEKALGRLNELVVCNDALSLLALEDEVDHLLSDPTLGIAEIQSTITANATMANNYKGDVLLALANYNRDARAEERFEAFGGMDARDTDFTPIYAQLVTLRQRVRSQLVAQKDVGLVKNLSALRTAEASFKDVFTRQFCYDILNQVDIGVRTLKSLNHELVKLKFGTDKFRIDWSEWVPEFKEYYNFFQAAYQLAEAKDGCDLFQDTSLSEQDCVVRDRLVKLLLTNDQVAAQRELQRIADYRNYRRYEIWKESDTGSRVKLSEWGTGSGGQLETPAYIVRAAVVTNRLKHFDKGMNLKLLVNDESFSKMDERRAHDVLRFIRDSLGMQVICAMPTKHAGALKSEFNKEWSFTRTSSENTGEVDFVSEVDERDLNPDQLRALWDQRRQDERARAMAAFEAAEAAAAGAASQQRLPV